MTGDTPAAQWHLTEKGRNDATVLGTSFAGRSVSTVWTSPERRAHETAALTFPLALVGARDELSEVKKPWYSSADEHANAAANYFHGEVIEGWERREDVITRIAQLKGDFRPLESLVLVSHAMFLTIWLDHEIGLDDPFSFWSDLRMPDVWEFNPEEKLLERIL